MSTICGSPGGQPFAHQHQNGNHETRWRDTIHIAEEMRNSVGSEIRARMEHAVLVSAIGAPTPN
jgi:hypothetical protein